MSRRREQTGRQQQAFEELLDPEYLDEVLTGSEGSSRKASANKAKGKKKSERAVFRLRADLPAERPSEGEQQELGINQLVSIFGEGLDREMLGEVYRSPQGGSVDATIKALAAMGFGADQPRPESPQASEQPQDKASPQGQSQLEPCWWDLLPRELRESIWERCNARDLARAARVCRAFAAHVRSLRATRTAVTVPPGLSDKSLRGFVEAFPAAERLTFRRRSLAERRHSLDWSNLFGAVAEGELRRVEKGGLPVRSLDLRYGATLGDQDVVRLLEFLPHLRELDLTGCPMISDASLAALSRHPANLHYMVDTGAAISTAPTQPESEVADGRQRPQTRQREFIECNMARLRLAHQPSAPQERPQIPEQLGLQALNITNCQLVTRQGLKRLLWEGNTAKSLRSLVVDGIQAVNTSALDFGPKSGLRMLRAQQCPRLKSFMALLPKEQCLRELNLTGCPNLKSVVLTTPNLFRLSLAQCPLLRELSVCAPALSELVLAQCGRLDHCHGNSRLGNLMRLNASCCPAMTSEGLARLLLQSPTLTTLDVTGCIGLERLDLAKQGQLQSLAIGGCHLLQKIDSEADCLSDVTAAGCSTLTEVRLLSTSMRLLNLQNCHQLAALQLPRLTPGEKLRFCVCGCDRLPGRSVAKLKQLGRAMPGLRARCGR